MFKVVLSYERTVFHTFLVNDVATNGKLSYDIGCPLSELRSSQRINSIAHRYYCIEIVECHGSIHFPITFCLNYRDFFGSCPLFSSFELNIFLK